MIKHHSIDANNIRIHAAEQGEGAAVLFCHGFPDTWRGWRRQMAAVAAAGYRAIALDMRGYGESSAPESPMLYTPFHTVGDLVGVLDSLAVSTAVLVGHDFGASISWNAAMMRPDRFKAVFGMSVPFTVPGGPNFLTRLREAGHDDYYMFSMMQPETDNLDPATLIPSALYWTSGSAPQETRWDPFDPQRSFTRPTPGPLPDWIDVDDLAGAIADFQRCGLRGPLNYYRAIQPFYEMIGAFAGATIKQPSFFLTGEVDGLRKVAPASFDTLLPGLPGLTEALLLPGVGHWPQLEATTAVNEALLSFLEKTSNSMSSR